MAKAAGMARARRSPPVLSGIWSFLPSAPDKQPLTGFEATSAVSFTAVWGVDLSKREAENPLRRSNWSKCGGWL